MSLEEVIKGVGVLVALIGSLVVAPGALSHLWFEQIAPWGIRVKERLRVFLSRFIPRLRRHRSVDLSDSAGLSDEVSSVVKTSTTAWHVGTSEMMIGQIQVRVDELAQKLNVLDDKTNEVRYKLEQRIYRLENELRGQLIQLGDELEQDRRQDVAVNANGLPLIGAGIVLSGIPDWIARLPFSLGWAIAALTLLLTAVIVWPGVRRRFAKR